MKKTILLSVGLAIIPLLMIAQDDIYFMPKESAKDTEKVAKNTEYRGSDRDVDEYNRRNLKSHYQKISTDSLGNSIIETEGTGYDATTKFNTYDEENFYEEDDYQYSRYMGRFDGFYGWYDPFFYGYRGWPLPYRYGFYLRWYSPWYYDWYYPYYNDFYGYYGWGWPYYNYGWGAWYYGYSGYRYSHRNVHTGTFNHGRPTYHNEQGNQRNGRFTGTQTGTFGSRPGRPSRKTNTNIYNGPNVSNNRFGGTRSTTVRTNERDRNIQPSTPVYNNQRSSFGGSRSGSFGSGNSSGSNRSGGGSFGGSRSGGSFGGRR